jgi:hypothetical protein
VIGQARAVRRPSQSLVQLSYQIIDLAQIGSLRLHTSHGNARAVPQHGRVRLTFGLHFSHPRPILDVSARVGGQ